MPNCFRLLRHCVRRAASRAAWTAGSNNAMRIAIIAITTNSSIRVKPARCELLAGPKRIENLLRKKRIGQKKWEATNGVAIHHSVGDDEICRHSKPLLTCADAGMWHS